MSDKSETQKSLTGGVDSNYVEKSISGTQQKDTKPISVTLTPLYEVYDEMKEDIFSRERTPKFPIGLTCIDDLLWGIHKKHLITIGARTSQGKSAFAINMVRHLADTKKKIVFMSLEMSRSQILERIMCNVCNINNIALQRGEGHSDVRRNEKIFENWVNTADVLIDDRYGYRFEDVKEVCEAIRPDFVFIDYIQMISAAGFRTKLDAIESYVRRIKQLSMELNFGIILLSQINRGGAADPSMSSYKGAGILEEHSDVCIVLIWNWEEGEFHVTVEKNRHGKTGKFRDEFEPQYSRFRDYVSTPKDTGLYQD